jgi:hypothetical protein
MHIKVRFGVRALLICDTVRLDSWEGHLVLHQVLLFLISDLLLNQYLIVIVMPVSLSHQVLCMPGNFVPTIISIKWPRQGESCVFSYNMVCDFASRVF